MTQAFTAEAIYGYVRAKLSEYWDRDFGQDPEELQALYRLTPDKLNIDQMTALFALKNSCAVMFIRDDAKVNIDDAAINAEISAMEPEKQEHAKAMQKYIKDMTFPYRVAIDANDFAKMMGIPDDMAKNRIKDWKKQYEVLGTEFITPEGNNMSLSQNRIENNTDKLMSLTIRFGGDSGGRGSSPPSEIDNATFYEADLVDIKDLAET